MKIDLMLLGGAVLIFVGGLYAAPGMQDERQSELSHYCEMRDIHHNSQGEYGWPAEAHTKFNDGDCHD